MQDFHHSPLDRNANLPLYHQLYQHLRDRIVAGEWKPGDLFPKDADLEIQYKVSRVTVRQALDLLVNENLVIRQRGRGTFVSNPKNMPHAHNSFSFSEEMTRRNLTPSTRVLSTLIAPVSKLTADQLRIEVGDELAIINRIRLANHEPQCLEQNFLVHRYCPGILNYDFNSESLSTVLETNYHIKLTKAYQTVSAIIPNKEVAGQLQMFKDQPVLYVERVIYSQANIPIEYRRIYYRADRFALQYEMHREGLPLLKPSQLLDGTKEQTQIQANTFS